jgi:lipoate-protein ligase A
VEDPSKAEATIRLSEDLVMLAEAERSGSRAFRVWTTVQPTVVIGRSVRPDTEVDLPFCEAERIPIVVRPSGGRSVLVGPGTVQYTYALPISACDGLRSIVGTKRFCNDLLQEASPALAKLRRDDSGDLTSNDRKVAGLALRRTRRAVLLHGTILVTADLELIARALAHPLREPAYRRGRSHHEFLTNLGELDHDALAKAVTERLAALV